MNRTALTIKMLNYLKANDLVSREALATYLECNVRNIVEYKKELEIAGYRIETIRGKYGGYRLLHEYLIPCIALDENEAGALQDVKYFLKNYNYTFLKDYENALIKIKNSLRHPIHEEELIYVEHRFTYQKDKYFLKQMQVAKQQRVCISMQYRSLQARSFEQRLIQPYECVYSEDGVYVLAYDVSVHKQHAFKFFKLSELRMKDVKLTTTRFTRDHDFQLSKHMGKQGLLKDVYHVKLEVYGQQAKLLAETSLGMQHSQQLKDDVLYVEFKMENKARVVSFVQSLGAFCKVIEPPEIRDEIISSLKQTLLWYNT
ncbi:MAG: helix-turn-helix transcriptional regulator [Breznakia sp.]